MVEFPLLVRRSARGLRRRSETYLRYRRPLTLTLIHQAASDPVHMWETSTSAASFHARLNVAPQTRSGMSWATARGAGASARGQLFLLCHKFRSTVAGF